MPSCKFADRGGTESENMRSKRSRNDKAFNSWHSDGICVFVAGILSLTMKLREKVQETRSDADSKAKSFLHTFVPARK